MQIEAYFRELVERHDLYAASAGYHADCAAEHSITVYLNWRGFARSGNACASAHGKTVHEAVEKALAEMAVERSPVPVNAEITVEAA